MSRFPAKAEQLQRKMLHSSSNSSNSRSCSGGSRSSMRPFNWRGRGSSERGRLGGSSSRQRKSTRRDETRGDKHAHARTLIHTHRGRNTHTRHTQTRSGRQYRFVGRHNGIMALADSHCGDIYTQQASGSVLGASQSPASHPSRVQEAAAVPTPRVREAESE